MAINGSVIDKIAQANDLIKTVNSLPTNPNVPNPLVASWNARIPAPAPASSPSAPSTVPST
jgi:hypothetical protein